MTQHILQERTKSRMRRLRYKRFFKPLIESLEKRFALAAVVWDGGAAGTGTNFADPVNWVGDIAPGPGDDAVIGTTGSQISVSTAASVRSLSISRPLLISSNGLTINGGTGAPTSNINAALTVAAGASLSLGANVQMSLGTSQVLTINGSMTLSSGDTLNLSTNYPGGSQVVVNGTLTATGATFNQTGGGSYPASLNVNAGGNLVVSNNSFNLPLYLPPANVAQLSAAGGGSDNKQFQDINISGGTLANGSTLNLNSIGTVSTASLRYVFPSGLTVATGAAVNVGANVSVLLPTSQVLTINGSMTLASGDTLSLSNSYPGGVQVVVNGTLTATGVTFNQTGGGSYPASLNVNAGGNLIVSNNSFNLPLYLPAANVRQLSAAGGGSDNKQFQDINITGGTLASGSTLNLNSIGTVSTASLRYVFPAGLTVASGAAVNVGANVSVLLPTSQVLTINGGMTLSNGDTLSLSNSYPGGSQVVVNGTLTATGATFNQTGGGSYPASLNVNAGGNLIVSNNSFNLQLYLPAANVAQLSAALGGSDNKQFQDINITGGTLAGGSTLNLNSIGTVSTASLRYILPTGLTVAGGAALNVGANVSVLLPTSQVLTINGSMTLAGGDTLSLSNSYPGGTQVVVNGTLTATGTTFNQTGGGSYPASLIVNTGGNLVVSNNSFNLPLYLPAANVPQLSAAGGGSDNKQFQDINITSGTLAGGSTLNLNSIGTVSTASLRYFFQSGFTVASGAALNVGANVSVQLGTNQSLTINGSLALAAGSTLSLNTNYPGGTQLVVNGTLTATSATINQVGNGYTSFLTVNSGGHLVASGTTFSVGQMTLNTGAVFNPGDLANNSFNLPLYLPAANVALLSAAGGGSDNKQFQDINILTGTLGSGSTLNLNAIGTVSTANLRYLFPNGFTIANGAALNVGAGVAVQLATNQMLTVSGALTLASGSVLSLNTNYPGGTQLVVNGTLTATSATINQLGNGYTSYLTVNSGGHLVASGTTFSVGQMTLNAGAVFNPGDLANNSFNLPLYLPAANVALLSAAGGGSDNKQFQDINILAGTLGSGSTLNLNLIGTVSTANLRYLFPNGFTVANGAAVNVGAGVVVQLATNQTLTVNGALTLATGSVLSLNTNYPGGTQLVVNGTLTATSATINQVGNGYTSYLAVNSGGHLVASGSTFSVGQMTLNTGAVFNPGDLANNSFNLPLFLPAANVALLSAAGGGSDNKQFQDINILAGTLAAGSTLNLNAIGTVTTANLRYLFPNGFTVANGAAVNVGAGVAVQLATNQTLTVSGALTLANSSVLSLNTNYPGGTQLVVNGSLTATNATINQVGNGYTSYLTVNSGGHLVASGSTFSVGQMTLSNGAVFNPGDLTNNNFNLPLYLPAANVALLSAAGGGADNQRFQDINILAGTLAAGATLNLNAIGTATTANLRYFFPNGFTVASGAAVNIAAGVPVQLATNQTLTVSGALTLASGSVLSLNTNYPGGTQVIVNGSLTATSATINQTGNGYSNSLTVNSGGRVVANDSTFAVGGLTSNTGAYISFNGSKVGSFNLGAGGASQTLANFASITSSNGATVTVPESLRIDSGSIVTVDPASALTIGGSLLGNNTNQAGFNPRGQVTFNGGGTAAAPLLLEAMSENRGAQAAGFSNNFAYGALVLTSSYVKLVDQSHNSAGSGAEAVYVGSIVVPAGSTLNLNGLTVYARNAQVAGTVVGGTITQIPDSGTLVLGNPTPGKIAVAGELDAWSFYGRRGMLITAAVDSGSGSLGGPIAPTLQWDQVQLLDPHGQVLATSTNSVAGAVNAFTNISLPEDGTYSLAVKAPAGHVSSTGNYVITAYDVTPNIAPLTVNQVVTGTLTSPYAVHQWTFAATANTQVRFDLLASSATGIQFRLDGPGGYLGFTNLAGDSSLVTLPTSGNYVLTAYGTGGATGSFAFEVEQTGQIDLTLGIAQQTAIAGSGQAQIYAVALPSPGVLQVNLLDANAQDQTELYVSLGKPPTRDQFDYRDASGTRADQNVLITAQAGTYYILVYNNFAVTPGSYLIQADFKPFVVTTTTPSKIGNKSDTTLQFNGMFPVTYGQGGTGSFPTHPKVQFVTPGGTLFPPVPIPLQPGSDFQANAAGTTSANALIPAHSLPSGQYDVRITDDNGYTQALSAPLTVVDGGIGVLETNLIVPNPIGLHVAATIYVEYRNTGDGPLVAPLLVLSATQNGVAGALLTLDPAKVGAGFWTSATPDGFAQSVQFLASGSSPGILQPGESMRVPVYYAGWLTSQWDFSRPPINFSLGVLNVDNTQPIDWPSLKSTLKPATLNTATWDAIFPNVTSELGDTWGEYVQNLNNSAQYLASVGQNVTDVGQLFNFQIQKANGIYPVSSLASATDAEVAAPGLSLSFSRSFSPGIIARNQSGRLGWGWSDSWSTSLSVDADGSVNILGPAGSQRRFQPDSRGGYFAQAGDHATLSTVAGGYRLTELNGQFSVYNSNGNLNYVQDTHGNRITTTFVAGQLTKLTHSSGQSLTFAYNGAGRIFTITDSAGRVTSYFYDGTNQFLASVVGFDGKTTSYQYDTGTLPASAHALTFITHSNGSHDYFSYDTAGKLTNAHRNGGVNDTDFSASEGRVTVTDALQNSTIFSFDQRGLLLQLQNPLQSTVRYAYDRDLNLTQTIDAAGQTYANTFDTWGDLLTSTDPLGHTVSYTYLCDYARLASLTDANTNTTLYGYNAKGDQTSTTYADGSIERAAYDPIGNVLNSTDRMGRVTQYTHNAAGSLLSATFADGSQSSFTYDAHENLKIATDATGTTTLTYDALDRLTQVTYPNGRFLHYVYNAAGQRTQMVDQTGFTVNYAYDVLGNLSDLTDGVGGRIVHYVYDLLGRLSREDHGNGTYSTYGYDAAGQLLHLVNYAPGGSVNSRFDYTYDLLGRRTTEATIDGQWTYSYDAIGQLTHAVFASSNVAIAAQDLAYFYDPAGNRTQTIINGVTTAYVTNKLNEYTRVGDTTYGYDLNGNQISATGPAGVTNYTFNVRNQLTSITNPGSSLVYTYDSIGNRRTLSIDGITNQYVIDPVGSGNIVAIVNGANAITTHNVYGIGLIGHANDAGAISYFDFNAQGATTGLTDATGHQVNSYSYLPFGGVSSSSETVGNDFLFGARSGFVENGDSTYSTPTGTYHPSTNNLGVSGISGMSNINAPFTEASPSSVDNGINILKLFYSESLGIAAHGYIDAARSAMGEEAAIAAHLNALPLIHTIGAINGISGIVGVLSGNPDPIGTGLGMAAWAADAGAVAVLGVELAGPLGAFALVYEVAHLVTDNKDNLIAYIDSHPRVADAIVDVAHSITSTFRDFEDFYNDLSKVVASNTDALFDLISAAVTSMDPNIKTGPAGFGSQNFVTTASPFPYKVEFENASTASAPAQRVEITDRLDPSLDWTTFQWTSVTFGDHVIRVPANSQHYVTTVPMTYNGSTFRVVIELNLDPVTGIVRALFQSLNSANVLTGNALCPGTLSLGPINPFADLPPDVLVGFLPPENGTGRGQGSIGFLVRPKADLSTGTEIRNTALIKFDQNAVIATDQVSETDPSLGIDPHKQALVTIDAGLPTSQVAALPATTASTSIAVAWSGTDLAGGSGLSSYDIFVSDNGGDYAPWMTATASTAGTYVGQVGHIYRFYSVARDNAGNREASPASADAQTAVESPLMINAVQSPAINEGTTVVTQIQIVAQAPGGGPVTFALSGSDQALFAVDASRRLVFVSPPDYETGAHTYAVTVTASDGVNQSFPLVFTVIVNDVNDTAPSLPFAASRTIAENETLVLSHSLIVDPDILGAPVFQITGGADASKFMVTAGGDLAFVAAKNFESDPHSYQVQVRAFDGLNVSPPVTITVNLVDTNDEPPVISTPTNLAVNENGSLVAALAATDPDQSGSVTFRISGGADQARFVIDSSGNLVFRTPPDFETSPHIFQVEVTANDGLHDSLPRLLTVSLNDLNDTFPVITTTSIAVPENTRVVLRPSSIYDPDSAGVLTCRIVGGPDAASFVIGADANLMFATPQDYEFSRHSFQVQVQALDGVNASAPVTLTVNLVDVSDQFIANDREFSVVANGSVSGVMPVTAVVGSALTFGVVIPPQFGTLTAFNAVTGSFTYVPSANATGMDVLTFVVTDGLSTDTGRIRFTVRNSGSVATAPAGGLVVNGTAGGDSIFVSRIGFNLVSVRLQNSVNQYPLTGQLVIDAGEGNDYVVVRDVPNATNINLGGGDDLALTGTADDTIVGGSGADRINAGGGNNTIWGDSVGEQDLAAGGDDNLTSLDGMDIVYGGGGNDRIDVGAGRDYVFAGAGNDVVLAGSGNDRIFGGLDDDTLTGEDGDDIVVGGNGNDSVGGNAGNDLLIGGVGADAILGGQGDDILVAGEMQSSGSATAGDSNDAALLAILVNWNASHAGALGTVLGDDAAVDILTGQIGDDDFYLSASDSATDLNAVGMGIDRRF